MGRVTNRVDPSALPDLLAAPCRATLAWEDAGRLQLAPVRYRGQRGRHLLAPAPDAPQPRPGARASLVLDDGWSWFALRAVTLRGTLAPGPDRPPQGAGSAGRWLELVPEKVTAWDYGTLHAEDEA
jgi:hypothetical protein